MRRGLGFHIILFSQETKMKMKENSKDITCNLTLYVSKDFKYFTLSKIENE